ncbi:MAG: site-2 protease family protein [Planctomycetia bacterium]
MLLAEPQESGADWRFELFGVRVRVSVWFWLAAALLGWNVCQSFSGGDQRTLLQMLVIWIGVVFVSILVHEFGHALAYRFFGQGAHVVLYHFGGLAIPEAWGRRTHLRPLQRLLVSAAGPAAQLLLAAAVVFALKAAGMAVPFPLEDLGRRLGLFSGRDFSSPFTFAACEFLLFVNIFWPLLNLVPVPPLDGGQIVREGLLAAHVSDAHRIAGIVGVLAGGAVAWWGYTRHEPYLAIMFAMLAASCFQSLSAGSPPWRRWN